MHHGHLVPEHIINTIGTCSLARQSLSPEDYPKLAGIEASNVQDPCRGSLGLGDLMSSTSIHSTTTAVTGVVEMITTYGNLHKSSGLLSTRLHHG